MTAEQRAELKERAVWALVFFAAATVAFGLAVHATVLHDWVVAIILCVVGRGCLAAGRGIADESRRLRMMYLDHAHGRPAR